MERKSVQVYTPAKNVLQDLKKKLGLSNESEVILYLNAIYEGHLPKLTVIEDQEAKRKMKDMINQETM